MINGPRISTFASPHRSVVKPKIEIQGEITEPIRTYGKGLTFISIVGFTLVHIGIVDGFTVGATITKS